MTALPAGWAEVPIGEVCGVVGGSTPNTQVAEYWDGDIPWLTPDDLAKDRSQYVAEGRRKITDAGYASCSTQLVPPGTVLFTSRAPIGYVALARQRLCTNQGFKSFVPSAGIDSKYLYWYLCWATPTIRQMGSGTTFAEISGKVAKTIAVRLAPAAEQVRIVDAIEEQFSRVDAGVAPLDRILGKVERLRSTVFSLCDRDAWPRKPWGKLGTSQNGRAFPSSDYCDTGVRLLRPGNLHVSGWVEWMAHNTRHMPVRYAEDFSNYMVGPNEVVINLTAQSLKDEFLGRVSLTRPHDNCLLNQRIARLRPPPDIEPRFLLYTLKSRRFRRFVGSLNTGSLIQHMFTRQIDEYAIPLPPLDEQLEAVRRVDRQLSLLDTVTQAVKLSGLRADPLRRSILEQAFAGRLVPQDPSDEPASELLRRIDDERRALATTKRKSGGRVGTVKS